MGGSGEIAPQYIQVVQGAKINDLMIGRENKDTLSPPYPSLLPLIRPFSPPLEIQVALQCSSTLLPKSHTLLCCFSSPSAFRAASAYPVQSLFRHGGPRPMPLCVQNLIVEYAHTRPSAYVNRAQTINAHAKFFTGWVRKWRKGGLSP